jgi:hypothetical protein
MSRPKRNQAAVIAGMIVILCVSMAALKRYRASAAGTARADADATAAADTTAPSVASGSASAAPLAQASPSPSSPPTSQTLRVWMFGPYLYPRTIYAHPGPTLIRVQNQSGINVSLVLARQSTSVATVSTQNETNSTVGGPPPASATGVVMLSPGSYIFYDQARPAMTGIIVVGSN